MRFWESIPGLILRSVLFIPAMMLAYLLVSFFYWAVVGPHWFPDVVGSLSEIGHFGNSWISGPSFLAALGSSQAFALAAVGGFVCPSKRVGLVVAGGFAGYELFLFSQVAFQDRAWQFLVGDGVRSFAVVAVCALCVCSWWNAGIFDETPAGNDRSSSSLKDAEENADWQQIHLEDDSDDSRFRPR